MPYQADALTLRVAGESVAGAELALAAKAVTDLLELARMTDAAGRTGKQDLN